MSRHNLVQRDSQIYFMEPIRYKINKQLDIHIRYSLCTYNYNCRPNVT